MPRGIPKSGIRKKKVLKTFSNDPELQKKFEEFKAGLEGKAPVVNTGAPTSKGEGDLPPVSEVPPVQENPNEKLKEEKKEIPNTLPFNAFESAKGLSVMIGMLANFLLWRQGRELVNDMEITTYATEITPFVDKYQKYFQYMPEVRAVIGTAGFVWAISQKSVVDVKKNNAYKESKNAR